MIGACILCVFLFHFSLNSFIFKLRYKQHNLVLASGVQHNDSDICIHYKTTAMVSLVNLSPYIVTQLFSL